MPHDDDEYDDEYDDGYGDETEDEHLFNVNVHEILNHMVIPRIESVIAEIQEELPGVDKREFGNELHKRLFNDDVMQKLYEVGFEDDDFHNIELNVFSIELGGEFDSIVDKLDSIEDEAEKQEYIMNLIEDRDKYLTTCDKDDHITFNAYDVKEGLQADSIDPISEEDFKKMLGK